jgi:signal transduction histidine kinase
VLQPGGEPSMNVLRVVREELQIELQAALAEAREKRVAIDCKPIPVRFNGDVRPVVLHVRPALETDRDEFALIIFEEREPPKEIDETIESTQWSTERIQKLENELALARKQSQSLIKEYETSREEMRSSAEEMQSTNEELRSTMEELETSKEELQSINEELQTVNQQNRHKVEELAQLSSDLHNHLAATDIATLFLDRECRILRFTPKLGDLFNVRITDHGRPIADLTNRLGYSELEEDATTVLKRLQPIEREMQDKAGTWYLTRVLPYRSTQDRIDGVVITFIDIHQRKLAEEHLLRVERDLRVSNEALVRSNADLKHFSYAISHDMQEPLRMVMSYTQLMVRELNNLNPKMSQYMGYAVEGAMRMETLLNALRDYWAVDEDKPQVAKLTDANAALAQALSYLQEVIEKTGAVVTHDPLPTILIEEYPLTLLFQNLVSNAIKYQRPDTQPRIHVAAERNGTAWKFSVTDNGIGIEEEDLENIFAPFKRIHGRQYPGSGLGLAMCRKIVERYNGRIWLDSIFGQGSTFRFTLSHSGSEV